MRCASNSSARRSALPLLGGQLCLEILWKSYGTCEKSMENIYIRGIYGTRGSGTLKDLEISMIEWRNSQFDPEHFSNFQWKLYI